MTEAGLRNVPLNEAMDMSGHRDVKTALGYMQRADLTRSHAARMLDEPAPGRSGDDVGD